jgi:hypothetical protein
MRLSLDLGLGSVATLNAGVGYVAEAADLFARWEAAGFTPSTTLKSATNTAINDLIDAGVWAKIDSLKVFDLAGENTTITPGLLDWKNATYDGSVVGAGTFTQGAGWAGNGSTGYINLAFNPATALAPNFVQNSAYFGIWSNTVAQSSGSYAGYFDGTKGVTTNGRSTGDGFSNRINSATTGGSAGGTVIDGSGLFGSARNGAATERVARNGVQLGTGTVASAAVANGALRLGNFGTATFSTLQFRAAIAGSYLTLVEEAALYTALATFLAGP